MIIDIEIKDHGVTLAVPIELGSQDGTEVDVRRRTTRGCATVGSQECGERAQEDLLNGRSVHCTVL